MFGGSTLKRYDNEYLRKHLYSGVLSDVMDGMGYRNQMLGNRIFPLQEDTRLFGPAFTSIATTVYSMPENPLVAQCRTVDQLREGEIYVCVMRGSYNCALFGELFATAIQGKRGAGVLLDGYARDIKALKEMNFPLFYAGRDPRTSKGRAEINECQIPVVIDGVSINPGDLVFGDIDGIAIIPAAIADEVIEKALETIASEDIVRDKLREGATLYSVYAKHGTI